MARQKSVKKIIEDACEEEPRDEHGLTGKQRAFLSARKTVLDDLAAFDLVPKLDRPLFENWMQEPDFETAYKEQVPKTGLQQAREMIDSLVPSAVALLERVLLGGEVNKWQWKAVEALLKVGGLQRIYLDIQQIHVPVEAVLAIADLRQGVLPPPQMLDVARKFFPDEVGKLEPLALPPGEIIEGEVISVDEG